MKPFLTLAFFWGTFLFRLKYDDAISVRDIFAFHGNKFIHFLWSFSSFYGLLLFSAFFVWIRFGSVQRDVSVFMSWAKYIVPPRISRFSIFYTPKHYLIILLGHSNSENLLLCLLLFLLFHYGVFLGKQNCNVIRKKFFFVLLLLHSFRPRIYFWIVNIVNISISFSAHLPLLRRKILTEKAFIIFHQRVS